MAALSDDQVRRIAGKLASRLAARTQAQAETPAAGSAGQVASPLSTVAPATPGRAAPARAAPAPLTPRAVTAGLSEGIYPDVDLAVAAARRAFDELQRGTLELRYHIIATIRRSMLAQVEALSRMAREETGLGRVEDKIRKNRLVTIKTPGPEDLLPRTVTGDRGLTLTERAPFGVIAAITPVTNPSSTIICNAIGMVSAGNSVVFNPHPSAKGVCCETVRLLNRAILEAGGPANIVTSVAEPTIESAQKLMRHEGVRLLVVTGGIGVVREAMKSGKRAICAGPGNPPVVVDETADIEQAGRDIVLGASLDNNIICTDEKETFVVTEVADRLIDAMRRNGAYVVDRRQLEALENVVFESTKGPRKPGSINRKLIGKNAGVILERIGVRVGPEVRLVVAEVPIDHPLVWTEQMMPVMPVARVGHADEAIDLAVEAEHGFRHTAAMHSKHIDRLSRMAREMNCSIFVKNGPCYAGLGEGGEGHSSFTIASPTGEGLTGPRAFSRERRCVLVDHFRIV